MCFEFRQSCVLYSGKVVFCIQAKLCFVFRQSCVLYSGKSDLFLAFAQRHGIILTEILGPCVGGKAPHLKGGLGAKPPV